MKIVSTEYITIYNILFEDVNYIRQVFTTPNGNNEDAIWFYNDDVMFNPISDKKKIKQLEKAFIKNIQ